MKNDKIVEVYNAIVPNADAKNRILIIVKQQAAKKNSSRQFHKKVIAVATTAAVILFAVFGINHFNQTNDIFHSPFAMTTYAMERQPDGTYTWREVDISQLYGWGIHYDGEVLYIGLGLWFEFEGENIKTVEFSLEDGFFATQYIGNRGAVPNTPSSHVSIPPDFTVFRLVMYGDEFEKIGSTISFGDTMPDDILLFWGSCDIGYDEWWIENNKVIEIDVNVTFEDGGNHNQQLVLDFSDRQDGGIGWIAPGVLPDIAIMLDWLTDEQLEFISTAPIEHFTLLPDALKELESIDDLERAFQATHEFHIGEHDPIGISAEAFLYHEVTKIPMGARDGKGFVIIITLDDNDVPIVNAYSIPLN